MMRSSVRDAFMSEWATLGIGVSGAALGEPGYQGRTSDESRPRGWTPSSAAYDPVVSTTPDAGAPSFHSELMKEFFGTVSPVAEQPQYLASNGTDMWLGNSDTPIPVPLGYVEIGGRLFVRWVVNGEIRDVPADFGEEIVVVASRDPAGSVDPGRNAEPPPLPRSQSPGENQGHEERTPTWGNSPGVAPIVVVPPPASWSQSPSGEQGRDWTTVTGWNLPGHGPFGMITSYDSGNRAVNVVLNKVILPWFNALTFVENVTGLADATIGGLRVLARVDHFLASSPIGVEYRETQDLLPMFPVMGLAMAETRAATSALATYGRAATDVGAWAARSSPFLVGGVSGGGVLPLRSAAARAAFGWETGLVNVGEGRLGFSSYRTGSSVKQALGMGGAAMEDMHMLPQAIGRTLPSSYRYNANTALTTAAPRLLHRAWDSTWIPVWNEAVRSGRRMTGRDVHEMLLAALENPRPDPVTGEVHRFTPEVRGTIAFAIESEMKALGIEATTVVLP